MYHFKTASEMKTFRNSSIKALCLLKKKKKKEGDIK